MTVLHEIALGQKAFAALPSRVREFHVQAGGRPWVGEAEITGNSGLCARAIRWCVGFPEPGGRVSAEVRTRITGEGVMWQRTFGQRTFRSTLSADPAPGVVRERFGMLTFRLHLSSTPDGIAWPIVGWYVIGIPMPMLLAPRSDTLEGVDGQGRYAFDMAVSLPLVGQLVRYRGWLMPT